MAAKAEIENSEGKLAEKDDMMSSMQAQLAEAREQAMKDQEALLKAMEQMHVKEDTQEDDQEHGGKQRFTDGCSFIYQNSEHSAVIDRLLQSAVGRAIKCLWFVPYRCNFL